MAQKRYGSYPEQRFTFEGDPETFVVIRQATFGDEMVRSELLSSGKISWTEGRQEITQETAVSGAKLRATEIYLTFVESNLLNEQGEQIFPEKRLAQPLFERALGMLPAALVEEWHRYVLEVNPDWAPKRGE